MKELVRFSLLRRFNNKACKSFNLIVFIAIGLFAFGDLILEVVNPGMFNKEVIYVENVPDEMLSYMKEVNAQQFQFKIVKENHGELVEKNQIILEKKEDQYYIHSKYALHEMQLSQVKFMLNGYHQKILIKNQEDANLLEAYQSDVKLENKISNKEVALSTDKANLLFLFVTSIYFMMLSFISGVASEVVNEKTTKTLELILTSVKAKTHFFAKLIVGWLVIVIQGVMSISYILFWLLVRSIYDQGTGIILLVKNLNLIEIKGNNFYGVLSSFDFSISFLQQCFFILIFLLLGILFLQLVMVVVSSFVSTIEEAGNIQAPFYLLLLAIYYLVIAINNPHELSEGIGYYLSFVPFVSMLVMPCRMMIQQVPLFEIALSIMISVYIIRYLIRKGVVLYEVGVLDYSCKGFMHVIKAIRSKP